ncbi:MAG: type II 3-dehydroquinate dehydratase [Bifidobacteriaceae bacterium]|jgi:3-dehydroquinate dehydratase-2|nr:type II 3-dehydroquinate dehydratase [Bifidobacteriaceae bacterium]
MTVPAPAAPPSPAAGRPVWVLNGPNLGRLGAREPEIYGRAGLDDLRQACLQWGQELGLAVEVRQTDSEAELIGWLHQAADQAIAVVLNPAAFTHYSYGLRDAVVQVPLVIEVHLSNPAAREEFRHNSVISAVAKGTIAGFGVDSYYLALSELARLAAAST